MLSLKALPYNVIFLHLLLYAYHAAFLLLNIQYWILFKPISFALFPGISPGLLRPSCRCGQSLPRLSSHKKTATRYNPAMAASVVSSDFQFCVTFFHRKNPERQRTETTSSALKGSRQITRRDATETRRTLFQASTVLSKPFAECHLIFFN